MVCEVLKEDTCVLVPREYKALREKMNPIYQAICDVLFHSGMRIEEFWYFVAHTDCYKPSRRCISLPKDAIKKVKTKYKSRDVILSIKGCEAVEYLIKMKPKRITRQAMNEGISRAAREAGIGDGGMCPKMFRKMYISYLTAIYKDTPGRYVWINASAGHTADVQLNNYLATQFEGRDVDDMRIEMRGWGEA